MAAFDSLLSDPYISNLLSISSNSRQPLQQADTRTMSKTTLGPSNSGGVPNLIQLLESVPPPITLLLVDLAPVISWLRWGVEVVSWKTHWSNSWLTLVGWWTLCLSTNAILKYLLPLTFLPALLLYLPSRRTAPQAPPMTESSITKSLSDLTTLRSLLPALPVLSPVPLVTVLRVSALLYLPYLLLTYFVPMPILLGIMGTLLITFRAPWACTLRTVFSRSAYVQRFLLYLWFILSGSNASLHEPFDAKRVLLTTSNQVRSQTASVHPSPPVRFLFTILECQRWWMGLDWTAALLPGERPSWCDVHHQPVTPPSAFSLPPPTSVFLATYNNKRIKRTATWRWEDREWGIMVNKDDRGPTRIEKKPANSEDEEGGSRLATKAASMLKERTANMASVSEPTNRRDDRDLSVDATDGAGGDLGRGESFATDSDGWVYGDNKWEAVSAKGGLGKFTRYRRWARIAVLEETVEEVGPGDLGVLKDPIDRIKSAREEETERGHGQPNGAEKGTMNTSECSKKCNEKENSRGRGEDNGSPLRERLKSAVKNVGSS